MRTGPGFLHSLPRASSADTGLRLSRCVRGWRFCSKMGFLVVPGDEGMEQDPVPGRERVLRVPRSQRSRCSHHSGTTKALGLREQMGGAQGHTASQPQVSGLPASRPNPQEIRGQGR